MTGKITALLLIMLLSFALLAGCGAKDADPEQKPPESTAPSLSESAEASSSEQPEPESSDDETSPESSEAAPVSPPAQFRLTFFYPECCRSFMVVPSLSGGEYIVSPSRSEKENLTKNTYAISYDSHTETDLGFYGYDVQADDRFYYWTDFGEKNGDPVYLTKTDKSTLEHTVICQIETENQILPRLTLYGDMLVWLEYSEESNTYCFRVCDIGTGNIRTAAESNFIYSPYMRPWIKNGWLAYAEAPDEYFTDDYWNTGMLTEGVFTVRCVSLTDPSTNGWEYALTSEPMALFTDGDRLFWSNDDGVCFFDLSSGEVTQVAESGVGMELLLGRYIVYSDNFSLHVYDIDTRALIFSSDPDDGNMYIQWPQANSDSTMAVTYGNSRSDTDTNFIATIEIAEN